MGETHRATDEGYDNEKASYPGDSGGVLVTASAPSLAAKRIHQQSDDAYGAYARDLNSDRSGSYYYGPNTGGAAVGEVRGSQGFSTPGYIGTQNQPYPDRPYGAPDTW